MEAGSRHGTRYGPGRIADLGDLSPPPSDYSAASWDGGVFQRASRSWTDIVEGRITPSAPILMVTLSGGARRHELSTDDGLRFDGPDRAGLVSFLPARCERRLRLHDVEWSWASITFGGSEGTVVPRELSNVPAFCGVHDPVIRGVLGEMARIHEADGHLDPSYCEAFSMMLTAYIGRRFGAIERDVPPKGLRLTGHQLRRLDEYVDAHLDEPIRVGSLAGVLSISEGHLHRALRMTTGETPLTFVNRRRIERAAALFRTSPLGVQDAALAVGFASPSAFARVFRTIMGRSPSEYRQAAQQ
jgi:AraC family transcriptional regulator